MIQSPTNTTIAVLGPLQVHIDGENIPISGERQRRVVAVLVDAGSSGASVDQLAEVVWDDTDRPDDPTPHLRTTVSRLRNQISRMGLDATTVIESRPGGYRIGDGVDVDAWRFEDLLVGNGTETDPEERLAAIDTALASWRGDPFDGFDLSLLAPSITRLAELRIAAEVERLDLWLEQGEPTRVLARVIPLIKSHPWQEGLRRLHALALYRLGRQTAALRALDDYRRLLAEELGLEPGPALTELEVAILNHDASIGVGHETGRALRGYRVYEVVAHTSEHPSAVRRRARQPSLGRDVVIESVSVEREDEAGLILDVDDRARIRAGIRHPHLEPLIDWWREPGTVQLVTPLYEESLADLLSAGPIDATAAMALLAEMGAALGAVHDAGISHGDVRPGAVFLDDDGRSHLGCFPPLTGDDTRARRRDVDRMAALVAAALAGHPAPDAGELRSALASTADPGLAASVLLGEPGGGGPWEDARQLAAAFSAATGLQPPALLPVPAVESNPYPGLSGYDESRHADFYGREAVVEELCRAVYGRRLVVVTGASGSGKSSVVHAGLVPAIRAGQTPGSDRWVVATMTPGRDPMAGLADALGTVATVPAARPEDLLDAGQTAGEDPDRDLLSSAVAGVLGEDGELLLIVDQFEELYAAGVTGVGPFLDVLGRAADNPAGRARVVVTLRADFFDRPLQRQPFASVYRTAVVPLAPLTPDELDRAIARPAADRGVEITPGLRARLIADARAESGALPLVNVTLHELWQQRRSDVIDVDAYEALGGLTGALVGRAEALVESLGPNGADDLRRLFGRIVVMEIDQPPTRRRTRLADLYTAGIPAVVVEAAAQHRLISIDRDPISREPMVTVSHEAVLTRWPRLAGWLHEDRGRLYEHGRLADAAAGWEQDGRDPALLLRGTRLDRAIELADAGAALTRSERALLEASAADRAREEEAKRRQTRRRRNLAVLASTVAVIAVVAGIAALGQAQRADRAATTAQIRVLTQGAVTAYDERPDLALQLAVAAVERGGGAGAERTLVDLLSRPLFDRLLGTATDSICIALSPDPARQALLSFAVPDANGRSLVTRWSMNGGSSPAGGVLMDGRQCPVASPGGDRIAVVQAPTTLQLVDGDGGEVLASSNLASPIRELGWAADGTAVVALDAASDGALLLFDPSNLDLVTEIPLGVEFIAGVAVSSATGVAVVASDAAPPLIVDVPTGRTRVLEDPGSRVGTVAVVPAADLVVGRTETAVLAWSLATGELRWVESHSGAARGVGPLAVNASGSHVAVATDAGVEIFDAGSGRPLAEPIPVVGAFSALGFSGDDELVVSGAGDRLFVLSIAPRFDTVHDGYDAALVAADGSIATFVEDASGVRNVVVSRDGRETDLGTNPMIHRTIDGTTTVGYDLLARTYLVWENGAKTIEVDLSGRGPTVPESARSIRIGAGLAAISLVQDSDGPPDVDTSHLLVVEATTGRLLLDMAVPGVHLVEPVNDRQLLLADVDFSARLVDIDGQTVHRFGAFGHGIEAMAAADDGDLLFGLGDGSIVRHGHGSYQATMTYVGPPSAVMAILPFEAGFITQHLDGDIVKWYHESSEPAGTLFVGSGFAGFSSLSRDDTHVLVPEPGRVLAVPVSIDAFVAEACRRAGSTIDEAAWAAVTGSAPDDELNACRP